MAEIPNRQLAADSGLTLVEVMAAMFVLSMLALASLSTLSQSLALTRTNENRVVAANVATGAIESARIVDPGVLQQWAQLPRPASSVVSVVVGPTTYTVRHLVDPVETPTTSSCQGSGGTLRAFRIRVEVTWQGQNGIEPVQSETIRSLGIGDLPATTGGLAVSVKDRNGNPVANQRLDLTSPATASTVQTDSQGCGLFTGLPPRTDYHVATPSSNGDRVNRQGALAGSRSPLTVRAGALTHQEILYDTAVEVQAEIPGPTSYPAPSTLGVTVANPQLTSGNRTFTQCPSGTTVTATTLCVTGSPKRLLRLYPFLDGYQIWAGTCSDSRPAQPLVVAPQPGRPVPNVALSTAPLKVKGADVLSTITAISSCGTRHVLGTMTTIGGTLQASLPPGLWTVEACLDLCLIKKAAPPVLLTIPAPTTVPEVLLQ